MLQRRPLQRLQRPSDDPRAPAAALQHCDLIARASVRRRSLQCIHITSIHHHHVIAGKAILEHPSGFASPPRAMPRHDDRAVAADRAWDRAGRKKKDPCGHLQGTVDRILQLGQTSVYQGGKNIPGDVDWLLANNIKLVVNCTGNLARPACFGSKHSRTEKVSLPCPQL